MSNSNKSLLDTVEDDVNGCLSNFFTIFLIGILLLLAIFTFLIFIIVQPSDFASHDFKNLGFITVVSILFFSIWLMKSLYYLNVEHMKENANYGKSMAIFLSAVSIPSGIIGIFRTIKFPDVTNAMEEYSLVSFVLFFIGCFLCYVGMRANKTSDHFVSRSFTSTSTPQSAQNIEVVSPILKYVIFPIIVSVVSSVLVWWLIGTDPVKATGLGAAIITLFLSIYATFKSS